MCNKSLAVCGSRCIVADLHLQRRGGGGRGDHLDAEVRGGSVFRPLGFSLIQNLGEGVSQARWLDPSLVYVLQFGLKIL